MPRVEGLPPMGKGGQDEQKCYRGFLSGQLRDTGVCVCVGGGGGVRVGCLSLWSWRYRRSSCPVCAENLTQELHNTLNQRVISQAHILTSKCFSVVWVGLAVRGVLQ